MVEIYTKLIINKRRTFDQVPDKFQADVKARLMEYGYDTNGRCNRFGGVIMFYILIQILIGGNNMVALYVALIINSRRTFSQVPAKFKGGGKRRSCSVGP